MFECASCYDEFYSKENCDKHMDDYDHWAECKTCDRRFRTYRAAEQHMSATNHWPRYECETCTSEFGSVAARDQHMRAEKHFERYCPDCDRHFINNNALRMHLNSKIHRGKTVLCPFCQSAFGSASGACTHLESGACPKAPTLNRETIYKVIRENDRSGMITNKLIGWKENEERIKWEVNPNAYNGNSWECYYCHQGFGSASSLRSHLNSPVHKQKVYHCPNKRGSCDKQFTSLAALFSHLESESCGMTRFENVQKGYHGMITGRGLIAF